MIGTERDSHIHVTDDDSEASQHSGFKGMKCQLSGASTEAVTGEGCVCCKSSLTNRPSSAKGGRGSCRTGRSPSSTTYFFGGKA